MKKNYLIFIIIYALLGNLCKNYLFLVLVCLAKEEMGWSQMLHNLFVWSLQKAKENGSNNAIANATQFFLASYLVATT